MPKIVITITSDNESEKPTFDSTEKTYRPPIDSDKYQIEDGVIRRYVGSDTRITIPDGVTGVGNGSAMSFMGTGVVSVKLPHSVKSIGGYAFCSCDTLSDITIPDSVTQIGHHAFRECKNLKSIKIPDGVSVIERECFWGCTGLKTAELPKNLKVIEEKAFSGCTVLQSVTIPEGAERIDDGAFWGDEKLETVVIPATVTHIGGMAFADCSSLTIHGTGGSFAQKYATNNNIPFVDLEMLSAENQRKAEEQRLQLEREKEEYRLATEAYESVPAKRSEYTDKLVSEMMEELVEKAKAKREQDIAEPVKRIKELNDKKAEAETALGKLGAFKFKEKKELKDTIERLSAEIAENEARIEQAEAAFSASVSDAYNAAEGKRSEFEAQAAEKYPFPKKPQKTALMIKEEADKKRAEEEEWKRKCSDNNYLMSRIKEFLSDGEKRSATEVMNAIPELKNASSAKVNSLLRKLVDEGDVLSVDIKRRRYYYIW